GLGRPRPELRSTLFSLLTMRRVARRGWWGFGQDYKIDKIVLVDGILSKKRGLGRPRPELRSALFSLLTKKACFFDKIVLVNGILSKKRGLGCPRPELRSTLFSLLTKKACFFDTIALMDGILQVLQSCRKILRAGCAGKRAQAAKRGGDAASTALREIHDPSDPSDPSDRTDPIPRPTAASLRQGCLTA
ncbi:MAG: hypothetical protein ACOX9C_12180, partial [Kiritimatiellia bacterium]